MSILEVHADLRRTNALLERLARCAEVAIHNVWGIRLGHINEPAPDANPQERESVGYANDPDTMKHELERLAGLASSTEDEDVSS